MRSAEENFTMGCPKCGKRYVFPPDVIGRTANCKCGRSFKIEIPADDLEEDEEEGDYGVAGS